MPPARRPEFEPALGSRETDASAASRRTEPDSDVVPAGPPHPEVPPANDVLQPPIADTAVTGEPLPPGTASGPQLPQPSSVPLLPDRPPVDSTPTAADASPVAEPPDGSSTGEEHRPPGLRWFRIRQRVVAVCAIAVLLGLAYYFVSLFQVWTTGRADDEGPVDAIVVMGAAQYDGRPSPQLAARLDHVVELWPRGIAPLVVVTGGNIPGDRFTEAQASATYLSERGVPTEALLQENEGSNSYESLEAVAALLDARGLDEVLIVTDPYHALRSRLIAEEVGLNASVSSTDTSVVTGGESLKRHFEEAAGVAVGRIIGFDRLTRLVD